MTVAVVRRRVGYVSPLASTLKKLKRDKTIDVGTRVIFDFKNSYCQNGVTLGAALSAGQTLLDLVSGQALTLGTAFPGGISAAGGLIFSSTAPNALWGTLPASCKMAGTVQRFMWTIWIKQGTQTAPATVAIAGCMDNATNAATQQISIQNTTAAPGTSFPCLVYGGSGGALTVAVGEVAQLGYEVIFVPGTSITINRFKNGALISTTTNTTSIPATLPVPTAAPGIGRIVNGTDNAGWQGALYRVRVDEIGANAVYTTGALLAAADYAQRVGQFS